MTFALVPLRRVLAGVEQGWSVQADAIPAEAGEVGVLRLDAIDRGVFSATRNKRVSRDDLQGDWRRYAVRDGDLLISRASGSLERLGDCAIAEVPGDRTLLFPDLLYRLRLNEQKIVGRYLFHVLRSSVGRSQIAPLARGAANNKLRIEDLRSVVVPLPALDEQHHIADALDQSIARISELDAVAARFAHLRDESYERLLNDMFRAAAGPMVKIRYVAKPGTGHTPSRSRPELWAPDECTVPWFTLADVGQIRGDRVEVVTETTERVSDQGLANSAAVLHPKATVLLSRTASVGFSAVMGRGMAVSQDFMTWTCGDKLDPFFLLFSLRAMRPELQRLMVGSTHKTIYMPDLLALKCPLPSLDEQRRRVGEVRSRLDQHWKLREESDRLRARLREYEDTLVSETVTEARDGSSRPRAQRGSFRPDDGARLETVA